MNTSSLDFAQGEIEIYLFIFLLIKRKKSLCKYTL